MSTSRVFLNNSRLSTGRTMSDNSFLQVYPELKKFASEADWRTLWVRKINDGLRFEVTGGASPVNKEVKASVPDKKETAPPPPPPANTGRNWICGYCRLPPGNDHRMCICRGYNYSVREWEDGRIWSNPAPAPAPNPSSVTTAKVIPAFTKTKESIKQKKNGRVIDWTCYPDMLKATAPAGKYYIGDLCYALHESTYDEVFGGTMYGSGLYECDEGFFMVDHTAYGDGAYRGSDRQEYCVDAGILGIASWSVVDENNSSLEGGQVHEFKEPVRIRFGGGRFEFTSPGKYLVIDTSGNEDEDDEDDC